MPKIVRNPAYDQLEAPDEVQSRLFAASKGVTNRVIPGSTSGGTMEGIDPHDKKFMEIVIDPHLQGYNDPKVINLSQISPEEMSRARELTANQNAGNTAVERKRSQNAAALCLLADANDYVPQELPVKPPSAAPTVAIVFTIKGIGRCPAVYDAVTLDGSTLVLSIREELAASTYFPGPDIEAPVGVEFNGQTRIAHTTTIKYTAVGLVNVVLLVDD